MRIMLSILSLSVCFASDCDEGYTEIDSECYYQSDLDVLDDFCELNEFCSPNYVEWENGRGKQG